jgi:hypothetical protein
MWFVSPISPSVSRGRKGAARTCCLRTGKGGRDLYLDVVGSSSLADTNVEAFAPGGAADRAVARKMSAYRDIMRVQSPSVVLRAFAFESLGGVHADALEFLARLQGRVNMAVLTSDDIVWYSVVRRVSMVIAKAEVGSYPLACRGGMVSPSGNCPARYEPVCMDVITFGERRL